MRKIARISTNVSERIFNISAFRGVNEAPEGEASLKLGEAAVMRNFRVTAGGALKKRPGSRDVASLLNSFVIRTAPEEELLFTDTGWRTRELRPRAEVDGEGVVHAAGDPAEVDPRNALAYAGWFTEANGDVWSLERCREIRAGWGTPIDGGTGERIGGDAESEERPGGLKRFASGQVDVSVSGQPTYYGTESVEVWPGAKIEDGSVTLTGTPATVPNAQFDGTGFATKNVGGFFMRDGRLWEYYGAKMESADLYRPWRKYEAQPDEWGSYSPGPELGTEFVRSEDEFEGTRVTDIFINDVRYVVVRNTSPTLGEQFFMYTLNTDDPTRYGTYNYGWYGYELDVKENTYEWYFKRTCAEGAENTDTQVRGIWSGFVGGREVICAVCGGFLWELQTDGEGSWTKTSAGALDTGADIYMFGFDEKLYLLGGGKYLVWDGNRLETVKGYRPLVSVSVVPTGGGTLLEGVNRLFCGRRCRFSPDGTAKTFQLPETEIASVDWVRDLTRGEDVHGYRWDLTAGTVTFNVAPERGVNSLEIAWSAKEDRRTEVCSMRYAELYNGAQDTRVFLYGDGSNRAVYSGLDYEGRPRADYFPDLYEVSVGDANTPLTAMIRHYNRLMAFKLDSAWSIGYDTITLVDGTVTAGFYVSPVNRSIGSCAWGQARLVQNRPRTLDGRSVIEWKATGSSGITGDQRNAERVSGRVDSSIRKFDLTKARTFYDKFSHEYYVIGEDGTAIVQNLDVDAWYVYTGLDVTCMINYRDELYYGTRDGYLRHFSDAYFSDNGADIDAYWESGAMSFDGDFRRKYSAMVWIGIKPEDNGYLEVTAETDRKSDFAVYDVRSLNAGGVPEMERIKLKAKKFTYYKLILRSNTADRTATVVSADMRVRGTGYVR